MVVTNSDKSIRLRAGVVPRTSKCPVKGNMIIGFEMRDCLGQGSKSALNGPQIK
jgi:hypothetical protein